MRYPSEDKSERERKIDGRKGEEERMKENPITKEEWIFDIATNKICSADKI